MGPHCAHKQTHLVVSPLQTVLAPPETSNYTRQFPTSLHNRDQPGCFPANNSTCFAKSVTHTACTFHISISQDQSTTDAKAVETLSSFNVFWHRPRRHSSTKLVTWCWSEEEWWRLNINKHPSFTCSANPGVKGYCWKGRYLIYIYVSPLLQKLTIHQLT